jgi:hypothetical protein
MKKCKSVLIVISSALLFISLNASDEVGYHNLPNGSPDYRDPKNLDISWLESNTEFKTPEGDYLKNSEYVFLPVSINIISLKEIMTEIRSVLENKSIAMSSDGEFLYDILNNQTHAERISDHLSDLILIYNSLGESNCISQKPLVASRIHDVAGTLMIQHLSINARMKYFKAESKRDAAINVINRFDKQLAPTIRSLEKLIKAIKLKSKSKKQEDESKSVEPKPSLKTP